MFIVCLIGFIVMFKYILDLRTDIDDLHEHLDYLERVVTYKTKGE